MIRIASLPINIARRVFPRVQLHPAARPAYKFRLAAATHPIADNAPFFKITDDDGTASSFLDALTNSRLETARGFISKNFASSIDVRELATILDGGASCKLLACAEFSNCPRNCKVKSVLVRDGDASCAVVHLRMIKEPDSVSNWKIYSVERES